MVARTYSTPRNVLAMTLLTFLDAYASQRFLKPTTLYSYRHAIAQFGNREVADFSKESISRFAQAQLASGLSPHTVKGRVLVLCILWRAAKDAGLTGDFSRPASPKCPPKIIRAIPPDSISRLLEHCEHLPGCLKSTRTPRSHYWSAFVAASYETALRTSDILQLRWDSSGRWHLIQVKTRRPVTVDVGDKTLLLLDRLSKSSPKLLDIGWRREWYCRGLQRIAAQLGLRISPQQLRQSAASEAERLQPGTAWILLGHSSPATTQRWYIDSEHAYRGLPRPRIPPRN